VCVVGLKEYNVEDVGIVKQLIESANQQRSVGSTAMNSDSSRSHSIMQFALKSGNDKLVGKLSFIDLAGEMRGVDAPGHVRCCKQRLVQWLPAHRNLSIVWEGQKFCQETPPRYPHDLV